MDEREISLRVNGLQKRVVVSTRLLLSDCLRHTLGLTGTHVGCEHGVCGCCTILIDGDPARSCLMLAVQADGASITTIEGLTNPDEPLHEVQQAMSQCSALQCGFCTPGFAMTIMDLVARNDSLSDAEIREGLAGNLCRCTGYDGLVSAVKVLQDKGDTT